MSEVASPKNEALVNKHKLKREKRLACNYHTLSKYDIKKLLQYCYIESAGLVEGLLIASLFTGRNIGELVPPETQFQIIEGTEFGTLNSTLEFPNWSKELALGSSHSVQSQSPFVFLPVAIIRKIGDTAKQDVNQIEEQAKLLLNKINTEFRTRLTLTRIKNYLSAQSKKSGLSQAEVNFIANVPLKNHGGSSYLSLNAAELASKHYKYINALMSIAELQHFNIEEICSLQQTSLKIGSNFSVPTALISSTIEELTSTIAAQQKYLKQGTADRWHLFNCYTYYTLLLLNMGTGHRPARSPFGQLSNFDLSRQVLFIADKKNRDESGRVVPLNNSAVQQLNYYLLFLTKFFEFIRYVYPEAATTLCESLRGRADLLHLWIDGRLKTCSPKAIREANIPHLRAKSNCHRHWIRSAVALSIDIQTPAIDAFMGHENLLDESFSQFSNLNFSNLRQIADVLEKQLCNINLTPLEVAI